MQVCKHVSMQNFILIKVFASSMQLYRPNLVLPKGELECGPAQSNLFLSFNWVQSKDSATLIFSHVLHVPDPDLLYYERSTFGPKQYLSLFDFLDLTF